MAYRGDEPAPLLPASVRDRIHGWLWRGLGFFVLAACAATSASLLTWSVADPSLTYATSGAARNLLGAPGAIISDMVMQMLGLSGVFILLPPLFWALQLLTADDPKGLRARLVLAPVSVLFLAGALSALPPASAWPMHHGYGGVLGDLGLGLMASLLAHVNADRSSAAAGLFYFAAGLTVLMSSLGLTRRELRQLCQTGSPPSLDTMAGWWRGLRREVLSRRPAPPPRPIHDPLREPPALRAALPVVAERPAPTIIEEADDPTAGPEILDSGRGASFDDHTDQASREIAKRFAPASAEARVAADGPPSPSPEAPAHIGRDSETSFRRPPLSLLRRGPAAKSGSDITQAELRAQARMLAGVLTDFGVRGEVKGVHPGPVVTLHEFEPARGVKSARVTNLADDIARSMGAASVRAAVMPGRNAIGIELPNRRRETVHLRELLESEAFQSASATLPLVLGRNISGEPVFADLARMPHLLVAGTTGSGKSVGVNAMILSLLCQLSPEQVRFLMIDPKMLELSVYNGIPHLLCPVVTDPAQAVAALEWVVAEMEARYKRMATLAVRNIDAFNSRVRQAARRGASASERDLAPLPYIVVVVDEFADLMLVAGKEIEGAVQRLAQMARAAGIHLVMATQRPSVDIVTGTIKANFPTRISYKVASKFDSRTILNEQGAEQLLGAGDMLYSNGGGRTLRVHGPFVSDEEVERIASYLREQGEPRYVNGITDIAGDDEDSEDAPAAGRPRSIDRALYDRAVAIVLGERRASASHLQRRLAIGYNRAADLIEVMERNGIVSAPGFRGRREVCTEKAGKPAEAW